MIIKVRSHNNNPIVQSTMHLVLLVKKLKLSSIKMKKWLLHSIDIFEVQSIL